MKLKGEFEKRVFITFFIVSFLLVFLMTFVEWNLLRYIINQHEAQHINKRVSEINHSIDSFASKRLTLLDDIIQETSLANHVEKNDLTAVRNLLSGKSQEANGFFTLYDNELNVLFGDRVIHLDDLLVSIMFSQRTFDNQFFVNIGNRSYHTTYGKLFSDNEERELLGILVYLEEFHLNRHNPSISFSYYQIAGLEQIGFIDLPENLKELSSKIKSNLQQSVSNVKKTDISRLSIDTAIGIIASYDVHNNPGLIFFLPYNRDFNSFAHKGLLILALIILAVALIMISLSGTWFSNHIIAPVKTVSETMKEIEENPARVKSISSDYHGILGDMVTTFNKMNSSLTKYNQSLREYKTIIDNLDTGVLWMNSSFEIILCNPSFLRILDSVSSDEIIGKKISTLFDIPDKLLKKASGKGLHLPNLEVNVQKQTKIVKFVVFSLKAVDDTAGLRYIGTVADITKETKETKARRRLEIELIKSNRLAELGRLIEGVVHNINSPLNTIVGYAQLVKKQYPANDDIDRILSAGNRAAQTVKQLMIKSREDSVSMMRPVEINEVVKRELEMCRHNIFFSQNVELSTALRRLDKQVNAAHADISLCIANLLNNAIQSMEESDEKKLTVKTQLSGDMITVEITDTGCGIEEEYLEKIFSPDFSTKTADDGEGFGLGLPISKSIAEKYKGYISVKSEPRRGSTFTLFLPWQ